MTYFVIYCSYCLAFWYGGKLVREGEMNVGSMLTVSTVFVNLSNAAACVALYHKDVYFYSICKTVASINEHRVYDVTS